MEIGKAYFGNTVVFGLGGPVGPPPFTPADIAKYWWEASTGLTLSGSEVISWTDSVNGYIVSQSTDANRPIQTTQAALNNQNVIQFDGVNDYLIGNPMSYASEGYAFSYVIVFNDNDAAQNSIMAQSNDGGGAGRLAIGNITSTTNLQAWGINFSNTGILTIGTGVSTGSHYAAWEYDGAGNVRSWLDDFTTPAATAGSGTANQNLINNSFLMGAYNGGGIGTINSIWMYSGSIAEVIFKVGTLSTDDLTNLETYITTKYAL